MVEINKSDSARERRRENYYGHCAWPARGACCCVTPCCISRKERSQCASTRAGGRGASFPNRGHPSLTTPFLISVSLPAHCRYYARCILTRQWLTCPASWQIEHFFSVPRSQKKNTHTNLWHYREQIVNRRKTGGLNRNLFSMRACE